MSPRALSPTGHQDRPKDRQSQNESQSWQYVAICSAYCYNQLKTQIIPQRSLRNDNAKVIEAVTRGESFVITRNGVPVAELRPVSEGHPKVLSKEALQALVDVGPRVDSQKLREDLDRVIDPYL